MVRIGTYERKPRANPSLCTKPIEWHLALTEEYLGICLDLLRRKGLGLVPEPGFEPGRPRGRGILSPKWAFSEKSMDAGIL